MVFLLVMGMPLQTVVYETQDARLNKSASPKASRISALVNIFPVLDLMLLLKLEIMTSIPIVYKNPTSLNNFVAFPRGIGRNDNDKSASGALATLWDSLFTASDLDGCL